VPSRLVLMNPGPVVVDERVREALLGPDICHREPEFSELLTRVRSLLVQVCGGSSSDAAVVFAGSGTTALEATISSIIPRHGKMLALDNGHYGERLLKIAAVHGIPYAHLAFGWANPIQLETVEACLANDPAITHVCMVHHETSTGMLNPVHLIGKLTATWKKQFIVDAISSLGGEELNVQADHIDWCIGTANKCIEGFPGVSFVCASKARFDELKSLPPRTFALNGYAHYLAQEFSKSPPFTPPVQTLYALETALDLLIAEGVPQRAQRYQTLAARLRAGMSNQGFRFLLSPEHWSNTLTAFYLPPAISYAELHQGLKAAGFVIYAGQEMLQERTFRIANMGQITLEDVDRFLFAVKAHLGGLIERFRCD